MIDRISRNEDKLDSILLVIRSLEEDLEIYKSNIKNISSLNKYYGSKNWFKDKDAYEKSIIPKVKAGVLSEDAIWNMNEDLDSLMKEMKKITDSYFKNK